MIVFLVLTCGDLRVNKQASHPVKKQQEKMPIFVH